MFSIRVFLLIGIAMLPSAGDAEYYEYPGSDGEPTRSDVLPPEAVEHGYKVFSDDGRLIEVVPDAAERERQRLESEAETADAQSASERQTEDRTLLELYASPDEARQSKQRALDDIDRFVALLKSGLRDVRAEIDRLERQLAQEEHSGRLGSDDLLRKLADLRAKERQLLDEIDQRREETERAARQWDSIIQRLEVLYGDPGS